MKMKKYSNWIFSMTAAILLTSMVATSCVDEIAFGDSFLEKAPGGSSTKDTVFNSAEYTRQFLTHLYTKQYYGIPYKNTSTPETSNSYLGKFDGITDCYVFTYTGGIINNYYLGQLSANHGIRSNRFHFLRNEVWEAVRMYWLLAENIDNVPGMEAKEKESIIAQGKCIMASRYFDIFRHYGGVPIIEKAYTGFEGTYELPRRSVESVVKYMIKLIDEAAPVLPWTVETPNVETGRWTRAAALALKCKILQFAASPLFNDDKPYYQGADTIVWYGSKRPELWDQCKQACEEFFTENANRYYLLQATGKRPEDYRLAYRKAYAYQDSPEILLSVRVTGTSNDTQYNWYSWSKNNGRGYSPTQEYMEMFPWADGKPFNWEETKTAGKLDEMFVTGTMAAKNLKLTRDPRLYEEIIVNGQPERLSWTNGNMSGNSTESWVAGSHAGQGAINQSGSYTTGYAPIKYLMGDDFNRMYTQWAAIRLSDIILTYAEALCQTGDYSGAIAQIDIVRARVGMKGLTESNPDKNLQDKDILMEEIIRERTCELGMEDSRFFDLIRYKRADIFAKPMHGLRIYRLDANGNRFDQPWYKGDKTLPYPTKFEYEVFELSNPKRVWWTNGFDPKWYLSPLPSTEVNKGYGLTQNPGW